MDNISVGDFERVRVECSLNHVECSLNHVERSLNHVECSLTQEALHAALDKDGTLTGSKEYKQKLKQVRQRLGLVISESVGDN
jgi:hypothetical protein